MGMTIGCVLGAYDGRAGPMGEEPAASPSKSVKAGEVTEKVCTTLCGLAHVRMRWGWWPGTEALALRFAHPCPIVFFFLLFFVGRCSDGSDSQGGGGHCVKPHTLHRHPRSTVKEHAARTRQDGACGSQPLALHFVLHFMFHFQPHDHTDSLS